VPSRRISTYGRGEDQPVASNASAGGRAMNRRVEIIIRPR
jgi:outer membrane protein OmpA-like peptidoglycan-associated protein